MAPDMSETDEVPTPEPKVLLLVDGSSYLYRAFHAMPDLRAVPGDPTSPATGAIRGMINMMQKLRRDVRADYAACVFDAPGKTFRDDVYPDYKATRSPMPDDLRAQIPAIHEVVQLLGWKVLNVPGVEADDVIGTLALGCTVTLCVWPPTRTSSIRLPASSIWMRSIFWFLRGSNLPSRSMGVWAEAVKGSRASRRNRARMGRL